MSDVLGISRSPAMGAMMNERIHQVNRNIAARNSLAFKNYNDTKQGLINNITGAKNTEATDKDTDRVEEGGQVMLLANDVQHIQDGLGIPGPNILGKVSKSINTVGAKLGSVPQGDSSVVENPLQTGSNEEFSLTEDGATGTAAGAGAEKGSSAIQQATIAEAASRGKILEAPKGSSVEAASVGDGAQAGAQAVAESAPGASAGAALAADGATDVEKVLPGASKLSTALDIGARGANVLAGGYDLYEDFAGKQKGLAGGNLSGQISNVAGVASGAAEAIGGVAAGLEAVGAAADLTGAGAILGVPLQIAGLAAGAISLGAGLISDISGKEKSDSNAVGAAQQAKAAGPAGGKPVAEATQAYQSNTLSGGYAGRADNQGRTQGTGAF